ncbi:LRR receptor-like serine threonine-protein kinase [Seminavis robusta]|uniref:LRR receptor-like serine threonine-protein kinase n=1 Tax=Seminavis robusta TaxID=568900 RepID=A0A9N8HA74_9STRA|nr:LRR receptor-like serine threonine-protein kinase [Seminavis robusta]|eukprot:Sro283_g107720.1 LRR receptor-like serine threonine-protein kinase (634) ;mRNA; r:33105-35265
MTTEEETGLGSPNNPEQEQTHQEQKEEEQQENEDRTSSQEGLVPLDLQEIVEARLKDLDATGSKQQHTLHFFQTEKSPHTHKTGAVGCTMVKGPQADLATHKKTAEYGEENVAIVDLARIMEARLRDSGLCQGENTTTQEQDDTRIELVDTNTNAAPEDMAQNGDKDRLMPLPQLERTAANRRAQVQPGAFPSGGNFQRTGENLETAEMTHIEPTTTQPPTIEPTNDNVLVTNLPEEEEGRPGAYAHVPGTGTELRRNTTLRRSLLGGGSLSSSLVDPSSQTLSSMQYESAQLPVQLGTARCIPEDGLAVADPVDSSHFRNLPQAQNYNGEIEETRRSEKDKQFKTRILGGGFLLIALAIIVLSVVLLHKKEDNVAPILPILPSMSPSEAPTMSLEGSIKALLEEDTLLALEEPDSPQSMAFEWLLEDYENWPLYTSGRVGFFPSKDSPPTTCNEDGIYQNLWLDFNNLGGSLPEEIYLLTSLKTFSLGYNHMQGTVSTLVGQMTSLKGLTMGSPLGIGTIPSELGLLTKLKYLGLQGNNDQVSLKGSIPSEIWQLTNLETLGMPRNSHLQGLIPSDVGMLSKLTWLNFNDCDLTGSIPTEIGLVTDLQWMILYGNRMTGTLPGELMHLSKLS